MQGSPEILSVKRSRAKAKDTTPAAVPVSKARKKTAKVAKPQGVPQGVKVGAVAAAQLATPDPAPLIATMAYFIAAERQFAPGHELDDWLEAERRLGGASS